MVGEDCSIVTLGINELGYDEYRWLLGVIDLVWRDTV